VLLKDALLRSACLTIVAAVVGIAAIRNGMVVAEALLRVAQVGRAHVVVVAGMRGVAQAKIRHEQALVVLAGVCSERISIIAICCCEAARRQLVGEDLHHASR
jgi:hypothetical protein